MNATAECTLVVCPNPLALADKVYATMPAGQTLTEMVGEDASQSLAIEIGGHAIPREMWAHARPKPGQVIHATNYPQGGNAGKWVRLVAIMVISYFTFGAGGAGAANGGWLGGTGLTGGALAAAYTAIGIVGVMAVTPMIGNAREVL